MKQNISGGTAVIIVVIVLAIAGLVMWRVYSAPSAPSMSDAKVKEAMKHPVGGGPTGKQLEYLREYQRTHPGAPSSVK